MRRTIGWRVLGLLGVVSLRSLLSVVTVEGMSMAPSLEPGQRLLMMRGVPSRYRVGDIVLVQSPEDAGHLFVKRVVAVAGQKLPEVVQAAHERQETTIVPPGHVVVLGEHPASLDSKRWGPVSVALVRAKLLVVLP